MCDGQISTDGELHVKVQYLNSIKYNMKWYWFKKTTTEQWHCYHTHNCKPMLGCHTVTEVKKPKSDCNKNQAPKSIQSSPICLIDYNHDFILDEINVEAKLNMIEKTF